MLWSEDIPVFRSEAAEVRIIAGDFGSTEALSPTPDSWASVKENHVAVWLIKLREGGSLELPLADEETNRSIYLYKGTSISIDNREIAVDQGADLEASVENVLINHGPEAHLLVLQGKPIGEPVVQQGPFVMNTQQEIYEAIQDYQRTQFGGWPWPKNEFVHERTKGRFALHSDGKEEVKD